MVDVVFGSTQAANPARDELVNVIQQTAWHGTLFFGYPVYRDAETTSTCDAILVTREHGVVLIDLSTSAPTNDGKSWAEDINERQDTVYRAINTQFLRFRELTSGRNLAFNIATVTVVPEKHDLARPFLATTSNLVTVDEFVDFASAQPETPEHIFRALNAALQRVVTIRPTNKRAYLKRENSRGATLQEIERQIANLDAWQKKAAIETVDGPQRIRGLAGSGKTIVLALKAAYLHTQHPDWTIYITFFTRALGQQIRDLIRRFTFEAIQDEPDWDKLRVLHAWGGRYEPGVYTEIAGSFGREWLTLDDARELFGDMAFQGACQRVVDAVPANATDDDASIDAILIDEAQDLPQSFFQMVYRATRSPKRIVWAYDELQNLGDYSMAPPEELFGVSSDGHPLVSLHDRPNQPKQDIVLPICYRNTPWTLAAAHALGFGIYRESNKPIQMFDDDRLWHDIGYEIRQGPLSAGHHVSLRRRPECSPDYFDRLLTVDDAVLFQRFDDEVAQARWVAEAIRRNIMADELLHRDILVVFPNALQARSQSGVLRRVLAKIGINSHLAGVTSSKDITFVDNSIAMTSIFRAKGNEAPMVYVMNADYCTTGLLDLGRRRNILFTAMTRSRAWLRVCGTGVRMDQLIGEFDRVKEHDFSLDFTYPTPEEIQTMRRLFRDRSEQEKEAYSRDIAAALRLINQVKQGELPLEALPEELRGMAQGVQALDEAHGDDASSADSIA